MLIIFLGVNQACLILPLNWDFSHKSIEFKVAARNHFYELAFKQDYTQWIKRIYQKKYSNLCNN